MLPFVKEVNRSFPVESDADETDAVRLETEQKNVNPILFKAEIGKSEDELSLLVKRIVKTVICKKALVLKDEILNEMNLKAAERELNSIFEELRINRKILTNLHEEMFSSAAAGLRSERIEKFRKTKETILKTIKKNKDYLVELEEKLEVMRSCWDFFRDNFKDEIMKVINSHLMAIEKSKLHGQGQWNEILPGVDPSPSGSVLIQWPDMG